MVQARVLLRSSVALCLVSLISYVILQPSIPGNLHLPDLLSSAASRNSTEHPPLKVIAFFAYSRAPKDLIKNIKLSIQSAESYKLHNPQLNTVLFSNADNSSEEMSVLLRSFDYFMPIDDGDFPEKKSWIPRVKALQNSPFQEILQVDSDTVCCGDISSVFDYSTNPFDIILGNHFGKNRFHPDNGVLFFRNPNSKEMSSLIQNWRNLMEKQIQESGKQDDQAPFSKALKYNHGNLKIGIWDPVYSCRFRPAENESWDKPDRHDVTMVLKSQVKIFHVQIVLGIQQEGKTGLCRVVNRYKDQARVIIRNREKLVYPFTDSQADNVLTTAFNQSQCDQSLTHSASCLKDHDWEPNLDPAAVARKIKF